jgi:O-methyltransferase
MKQLLKSLIRRPIKQMMRAFGLDIIALPRATSADGESSAPIPDAYFYRPHFSPWYDDGFGDFRSKAARVRPYTLNGSERLYVLHALARQASFLEGSWYECGVYKGGSAMLLAGLLPKGRDTCLRLFDTFEGMPETDPDRDIHRAGDFADTSVEAVRKRVLAATSDASRVTLHPGFIPQTFAGLEDDHIAFAHLDVDIFRSMWDCCQFIYPRLVTGGFMVIDDYGFASCPGTRQAIDEYFADKPEIPLVIWAGQAIVFRSPVREPVGR